MSALPPKPDIAGRQEMSAKCPKGDTRVKTHYFFHCDNTILIRFWKRVGIVSRNLFWLSDDQWQRIEPHLPTDV
ncbi:MAG: hypothetical protein WAM72_24410, partial [Xanthobacteraceae bacterium]